MTRTSVMWESSRSTYLVWSLLVHCGQDLDWEESVYQKQFTKSCRYHWIVQKSVNQTILIVDFQSCSYKGEEEKIAYQLWFSDFFFCMCIKRWMFACNCTTRILQRDNFKDTFIYSCSCWLICLRDRPFQRHQCT